MEKETVIDRMLLSQKGKVDFAGMVKRYGLFAGRNRKSGNLISH